LHYDVPGPVWYAEADDGLVRLGITPVGVALAREVLIFTPKRVGRRFDAGRGVAVVESAKWVGSVRAGFAGTIAAVNVALAARAEAVNADCYGAGWMLLVRPAAPDWRRGFVTGAAVGPAYETWMEREGFEGCSGG
jgi:glycine cleavage system H protein